MSARTRMAPLLLPMSGLLSALIRNGLATGQHYQRVRRENRKAAPSPRSRKKPKTKSDTPSSEGSSGDAMLILSEPGIEAGLTHHNSETGSYGKFHILSKP